MENLENLPITEFVNRLASDDPTPGGGAAAAVTGAMGVGALLMAMRFSTNKKMTESENEMLLERIDEFEESKNLFFTLVERDATEFEPLSNAYQLPRATDEEKEERQAAIEEGLVTASQTPIDLLNEAQKVVEGLDGILPLIKKSIISDIGVGLQHLRAALLSSSLNIYINANSMKNSERQKEYIEKADKVLEESIGAIDGYYEEIKDILL